MDDLLREVAKRASRYLVGLDGRDVAPPDEALKRLEELGGPLPDGPASPSEVLALLDEVGSPATVSTAGGRYFGFVTGGSLPAAMAANLLAGAWDQNAALVTMSPVAATLEEIALEWLLDVLSLPAEAGGGFVTGATGANFAALAAARHAILQKQGWDAEAQGLFGAPPVTVVVGDEVFITIDAEAYQE